MSQQMTPVTPSPSWHPPYDGPGYAPERKYLSGIPFKPARDRHETYAIYWISRFGRPAIVGCAV